VILSDGTTDGRVDAADVPQHTAGEDLASGIRVALRSRSKLLGSLVIWQTATQARAGFTPEQEEIAREVADDLSIALQQARLFEEVLAARESLQALSRRLVEVQEEERRHMARELHDEVGQALTGLKLILQVLPRLAPETATAKMSEAVQLVNELTEHTHDLALDLRPAMLDDFGLVSALLWLFDRYQFRTGIRVTPEFVNLEQRLPPNVETTGYRIVQEALTNVARYAGVAEVIVRLLRGPTTLRIQVQDAGAGFDVAAALAGGKRAGLAGMHERAALLGGWVKVDSAPSAGTQVMGVLPLSTP
jgi:signal transduction histidine kinase